MLRRVRPTFGVWAVLKQEMNNLSDLMRWEAKEYGAVLKGTNGMTEKDVHKKERKGEEMRKAMNEEAAKRGEQEALRWKQMHWKEKLQELLKLAKSAMSTKSAMASIIDHCTRAHAAEVAVEQGIDVKSVNVVREQASVEGEVKTSVSSGQKMVGYIEAPAASDEEVFAYAQKLQKSCPAARMYGDIEWRHGKPPPGSR